ncbi:MAG: ABC transporter ATP-binding protein [Lautropia sp.]|nr:ABC transporter ATP-binding protein [Lautropia sp.]
MNAPAKKTAGDRNTYAIRARGIRKAYRSGDIVTPVLNNVDISIPAAGLSVLHGPSGSGKTTLLNLMGLIDRPDSGSLHILGQDVRDLPDNQLSDFRRDHIGYVFQNFNLLPVLSALENVEYPLAIAGVPASTRRKRARQALRAVHLANVAEHRPNQLSGGQRQRVAVARALVKRPRLILADEPTANLDSQNSEAIITLLRRLQHDYRIAVVISSHDPQIQEQADHRFLLRDGALVRNQRPMY